MALFQKFTSYELHNPIIGLTCSSRNRVITRGTVLRLGDKGLEDPGPGLEWGEIRHGKNNKQLLKCSKCYSWSKQTLVSSKLGKF